MARKPKAGPETQPGVSKAIIDDIRAGLLNVSQIAKKHEVDYFVVYRLSKKMGNAADLHDAIVSRFNKEVVQTHIANNANDSVVVEENARALLEIARGHSKQVGRARDIATSLMADLENTIANREAIEDDIIADTAADKSPVRRTRMLNAVSLPANMKTLADLSGALKTLISLEREILNIKNTDADEGRQSLEDYVLTLEGESTRMPN